MASKAPPIGYPPDGPSACPQSIKSERFFRELLSLASSSKASALKIVVSDALREDGADWIRIPQKFHDSFRKTPLTNFLELKFVFTIPQAISLLYDLLCFMPALRSLDVTAFVHPDVEESTPDLPEFPYPMPPLPGLVRLVYGTGLGLRTLLTRVISPSADTLSEIDLYWHNPPKCAPALPRLSNVRSVITAGLYPQGIHLIRQCPRLSRLRIMMVTHEHLGDVTAALEESGAQLRDLAILPWRAELGVDDAAQLVSAIPRLPSLRRISIIARDVEDPSQLLKTCRERRICFHPQ